MNIKEVLWNKSPYKQGDELYFNGNKVVLLDISYIQCGGKTPFEYECRFEDNHIEWLHATVLDINR